MLTKPLMFFCLVFLVGMLLCIDGFVVLSLCMRVVCVSAVLWFGALTLAYIFTYARITHTCDILGFDLTSPTRLDIFK